MKTELDIAALRKYSELTADEVRQLVVMDKWSLSIQRLIEQIDVKIRQKISERLLQLGNRYAVTVDELKSELNRARSEMQFWLNIIEATK